MRKSQTKKLNGKEIEIKELRVKDILGFFYHDSKFELLDFKKFFEKFLPKVTNLTFEEMAELAPSELSQLFEIFKEVNADFINAFKSLGVENYLRKLGLDLQNTISKDLNAMFADSSQEDINKSGSTGFTSS